MTSPTPPLQEAANGPSLPRGPRLGPIDEAATGPSLPRGPRLGPIDVVLYQPEIPPNTGNVIRLCANTGCRLHLIEPLGFRMEDRELRRAGLDYHEWVEVRTWPDLGAFTAEIAPSRLLAYSTRASTLYTDIQYRQGDALLFGPETRGLPAELLDSLPPEQRLRLPMRPGVRSLNLSNSVAIAVYEAWRQLGFSGAG